MTANYLHNSVHIAERIRVAAVRAVEAHRPWHAEGISLALINCFLRSLDTVALDDLIHESLAEKLTDLDRCALAEASRTNDHAEAGRIVIRAIRQHADAVLCSHMPEGLRDAS